MKLLYLVVGGALGTVSRYWLSTAIHEQVGHGFPYGTLAVNVLGCLVVGVLTAVGQGQAHLSPEIRFIFLIGFCGAFTTFSTLVLETNHLMAGGQNWHAFGNIAVSVLAGFAAFLTGAWIGNKI